MGLVQRADPQRMGGHEELGGPLGRRHHRGSLSEGVRELSLMGTSGHRRHGEHRGRNSAPGAGSDRSGRSRHRGVPAVGLALAVALLAFGCEGRRAVKRVVVQPPPEENFTIGESPSLQFLPRQEEAPGWRMDWDPKVVPGDKLASYLGNEARQFAAYGDLDVAAGNYVAADGIGFATVEIFRFPDFVKAFGAYSVHKTGPMQFLNVENEAFASKTAIH